MLNSSSNLAKGTLKVNKQNLVYLAKGNPKAAKLMLFIHGAPERAEAWTDYLHHFGSDEIFAVAYTMRGYYPSSVPTDVKDYTLDALASDALGVAQALGFSSFILIGHDWGAATAWQTVIKYPSAVEKLIVFSNLHPVEYGMAYYQLKSHRDAVDAYIPKIRARISPWNREATLANNVENFRRITFTAASDPHISSEMKAAFMETWTYNNGESIEAIYKAYDALDWPLNPALKDVTSSESLPPNFIVKQPVLLFYGANDEFTAAEAQEKYKNSGFHPNTRYVQYPDGDHWVHHQYTQDAIAKITEFIR